MDELGLEEEFEIIEDMNASIFEKKNNTDIR